MRDATAKRSLCTPRVAPTFTTRESPCTATKTQGRQNSINKVINNNSNYIYIYIYIHTHTQSFAPVPGTKMLKLVDFPE